MSFIVTNAPLFAHGLLHWQSSVVKKVIQLNLGETMNSVVCANVFHDNHCYYILFSATALTCGDNEEYQSCGTLCQRTCRNSHGTASMTCYNDTCNEGCYCQEGYMLNDDGDCVKPSDCSR